MRFNKKRASSVFYRWLLLIFCILLIFCLSFLHVKPLVYTYAKSQAETILLNAANTAVLDVLSENNISYSDISHISYDSSGNITGIEIDIENINTLKSLVSNKIMQITAENNFSELKIPFGTLLGSEYTTGYGPYVSFRMQLTETTVLDFESKFDPAGINNVLHQIIINMDITANILMLGASEDFHLSTSAIAAQTVIAGVVPESFTNVEERPGDDIADELFNYADVN